MRIVHALRCALVAPVVLAALPSDTAAQALVPDWQRTFESPFGHNDEAVRLHSAGNGGLIGLFSAYNPELLRGQLAVVRYEADGSHAWTQIEPPLAANDPDLAVGADGSAVVASFSGATLVVRKLDAVSGATHWQRERAIVAAPVLLMARGPKLAVDPADGRVRVAVSHDGDYLILGYEADGTPMPDVTWGGDGIDVPTALVALADGGFAVTGIADDGNDGSEAYRTRVYDAGGALRHEDSESGDIGNAFTPAWLVPGENGGVFVAGGLESSCGVFQIRLWRLDGDGTRPWTWVWPSNPCHSAQPIGLQRAADGSLLIVSNGASPSSATTVTRLSDDGGLRWQRAWPGSRTSMAFATMPTGRTRVVGTVAVGGFGRYFVAEWTADGGLCATAIDAALWRGMAVAALEDGWAVGINGPGTGSSDAYLWRYSPVPACSVDPLFAHGFEP